MQGHSLGTGPDSVRVIVTRLQHQLRPLLELQGTLVGALQGVGMEKRLWTAEKSGSL